MSPSADLFVERERALEQVKRLYAVVMGLAIAQCLTSSYAFLQRINVLVDRDDRWMLYSILFAQVLSLLSLISLYYLGGERTLELRYLRTSHVTRLDLVLDLVAIGLPALIFFYLATVFSPTILGSEEIAVAKRVDARFDPDDFKKSVLERFRSFLQWLTAFYGVSLLAVILHWLSHRREGHNESKEAFKIWAGLNTLSMVVMGGLLAWIHFADSDKMKVLELRVSELNLVAVILVGLHLARFFYDYSRFFDMYFPARTMANPEMAGATTASSGDVQAKPRSIQDAGSSGVVAVTAQPANEAPAAASEPSPPRKDADTGSGIQAMSAGDGRNDRATAPDQSSAGPAAGTQNKPSPE